MILMRSCKFESIPVRMILHFYEFYVTGRVCLVQDKEIRSRDLFRTNPCVFLTREKRKADLQIKSPQPSSFKLIKANWGISLTHSGGNKKYAQWIITKHRKEL